jgi:NAD(P)-dependent dehydrogenase (short-subunit alcohol dehydrogenase family)
MDGGAALTLADTADQKAAIITGASQGVGAGLVSAYRELGYAVIANARSITPSEEPRRSHRVVITGLILHVTWKTRNAVRDRDRHG